MKEINAIQRIILFIAGMAVIFGGNPSHGWAVELVRIVGLLVGAVLLFCSAWKPNLFKGWLYK